MHRQAAGYHQVAERGTVRMSTEIEQAKYVAFDFLYQFQPFILFKNLKL
jgi:hypothetical protein